MKAFKEETSQLYSQRLNFFEYRLLSKYAPRFYIRCFSERMWVVTVVKVVVF